MSVVKEDLRRFGVREEDAEERVDGAGSEEQPKDHH